MLNQRLLQLLLTMLFMLATATSFAWGEKYLIARTFPQTTTAYLGGLAESGAIAIWTPPERHSDGTAAPGTAVLLDGESVTELSHSATEPRVLAMNDANAVGSIVASDLTVESAATWDYAGRITVLPATDTGARPSMAVAISESGKVLVQSSQAGAIDSWIWDGVSYTSISPNLGDPVNISASDINDAGEVVGSMSSRLAIGTVTEPFIYSGGNVESLGNLGGVEGSANAINQSGVVVGVSEMPDRRMQAFVWNSQKGIHPRFVFPKQSIAADINEGGVVVGSVFDTTSSVQGGAEAFVSFKTGDLNLLSDLVINLSGWERLVTADQINNSGQIMGYGIYSGRLSPFLATPIPEPRTCFLALLTLGGATGSLRVRGD